MAAPHYRKIELQSPADFTYLYANTVALSRQKLDLHLPPSATSNEAPDPMRERVRELVDEYINQTFTTASASVSINGLDSSSPQFPFPASFTAPETVEYEAYDSELASRVTALYAQLESLTTTVAQLRRDAPRKAAMEYGAQLERVLREEWEGEEIDDDNDHAGADGVEGRLEQSEAGDGGGSGENMEVDPAQEGRQRSSRRRDPTRPDPKWKLEIPLGTEEESERWRSGDMADVYERALRTLQRLQGEGDVGGEGHALATTVGKAERAGRAAEVVESM